MNSCILMARIVQAPERRVTPDGQSTLASMLVEFDALKEGDSPQRLKAVGWGRLADDIHQNYQVGDQVILQGSLRMNSFDRPEGFKEKRAELTISKIYKQAAGMSFQSLEETAPSSYNPPDNVVPMENYSRPPLSEPDAAVVAPAPAVSPAPSTLSDDDLDNIPF